MSLIFFDSYDHYATSQLSLKYDIYGAPIIEVGTGRNGTNCLSLIGTNQRVMKSHLNETTLVVGVAFKLAGYTQNFIQFFENVTAQCTIRTDVSGHIQFCRGTSTVLGTSTGQLVINTWYYIECKITIDNAVGAYEVRVNGVNWVSDSGVDTQSSANAWIDQTRLVRGSQVHRFDDFYLLNTTGDINNDFLGDVKVEALFPDSSGTYSQWTPNGAASNYLCVDETPPDEDTTYCSATGSSLKDTLSMGDLASADGIIYGMQTLLYARKDDAGEVFIEPVVRIGGSDYTLGTGAHSLGDSYIYHLSLEELNPDTSGSWTLSDVNNMEFGYNRSA